MKRALSVLIIVLVICLIFPFNSLKADSRILSINTLPYAITTVYSSGNLLFVGTENGFFVSTDSGKDFTERDRGLGDIHITGIVYVNGKIFLGTGEAGLYISNNLGKTWVSQMDKLNCPTISSISTENNIIYVTSLCTGFHFTVDFGKTWKDRNGGLPTLRTTAFVKTPSGRCFLGTDQFGLFYSDTLGKTCTWDKFFSPYTITSISYINSTLVIGTNEGIFVGDIKTDNFKKLNFIGGSPYILSVVHLQKSILVAVQGFGLFTSTNGKDFYNFDSNVFSDVSTLFYSLESILYVGTRDGNIYKIDLSIPFLVSPNKVNLGSVSKGNKLSGNIEIINIGSGKLGGDIKSPYFINFDKQKFYSSGIFSFTVDTSTLNEGNYTEVITIESNGGSAKIYVAFSVEKPYAVVVKLKIGSHTVLINGKETYLDAPPFIVASAGRTVVPVRFISEAFGAKVDWNPNARKVTIKKDPTENHPPLLLELWIGKKVVRVNLKEKIIDVSPLIIPPGRTMVPLRFIAETLGSDVSWDGVKREITIIYTP